MTKPKGAEAAPSGLMGRQRTTASRIAAKVEKTLEQPTSRRGFFKAAVGASAAAVATSATGCAPVDWDKLFQKHYKEMTPEDKERVFARIKQQALDRFDEEITVLDPPPMEDVSFVFCMNLSVCNGNRKCVEACVAENNQSREPALQYIKVVELDRGTFDLESGNLYYDHETVPQPGKVYLPMQCNQCDSPPCVSACPVEATWKEPDGIVVIDYDWCIGCRYCMAACPYEARRFNFAEPSIPKKQLNVNQGYLSNRVRPRGVVEKCHFCLHRTRSGAYPACLEACPTGARKFGNIADPNSEVAQIIREKRVFVLKEELKTSPRIYYYFD